MFFKRYRPLRKNKKIRDKNAEVKLKVRDFIYPYFVTEGKNIKNKINKFTDVYVFSVDKLLEDIKEVIDLGINKILLFGRISNKRKDLTGSFAYSEKNPVCLAIEEIKTKIKNIKVISDICLCPYTNTGHCGIVKGREILNDETLPYLAKMAILHAKKGADIVAPSAMMDGQVKVIRKILDENKLKNIKIMAYSAKYASNFYTPFREAANSSPLFGDRTTYQMDYRNIKQAIDEIKTDIQEGADIVMIKPAHTYLDVIREARNKFSDVKISAYHVSGEYMLIKSAVKCGIVDEEKAFTEIFTAIKRAGADYIITYYAKKFAKILKGKK